MPTTIERHGHSLGAGGLTATCIHNIRPREFHSDYTKFHGKEEIFIPFNVLLTVMPCHVEEGFLDSWTPGLSGST
jgi:hypothetical protein